MEVAAFTDLEAEFMARIERIAWCNVATNDTQNRPRSRILHPIWDGSANGGPIGWILTLKDTLKSKHLAHNPYVSLGYVADISKPVYADCVAEWEDRLEQKARIWEAFKNAPAPLGYDPAPIFGSIERENLGLMKLTPWRIEVRDVPGERYVWHS